MAFKTFPPKDPDAKLDYVFDWAPKRNHTGLSDWLREDEIIISHEVIVPEDTVVMVSDEITDNDSSVTIWFENGEEGNVSVKCKIVTNQGRKDTRTAIIPIKPR